MWNGTGLKWVSSWNLWGLDQFIFLCRLLLLALIRGDRRFPVTLEGLMSTLMEDHELLGVVCIVHTISPEDMIFVVFRTYWYPLFQFNWAVPIKYHVYDQGFRRRLIVSGYAKREHYAYISGWKVYCFALIENRKLTIAHWQRILGSWWNCRRNCKNIFGATRCNAITIYKPSLLKGDIQSPFRLTCGFDVL